MDAREDDASSTFNFPIQGGTIEIKIKNIPLLVIPTFIGNHTDELDIFIFEFDVLCCIYDYGTDAINLKLFPSTLKG